METKGSVLDALADALPLDLELRFYYISTPPTLSSALFSASPGQIEERTICETHFLGVSIPATGVWKKEILVFAIEVLVFTTQSLTTIFVSKADSSGYLPLLDRQPGTLSIIKVICATFLSYLIKDRLDGRRVLLSLFARSQNQYLFPGSVENPGKHVLDDRQLIKWWCRTLDPVLRGYELATTTLSQNGGSTTTSEAYIIVPGCDRFETRAFFPASTRSDLISRWSNAYPQDLIVPDGLAPPRCLIPRFPDDPKARFLDDLDSEISDSDLSSIGRWKSVRSLDQFWEMMSYRQECSAGRLVGFIWVVFTPRQHEKKSHVSPMNAVSEHTGRSASAVEDLPTPSPSQIKSTNPGLPSLLPEEGTIEPVKTVSPPPSFPIERLASASDQPNSEKEDMTSQQGEQQDPKHQQSNHEAQSTHVHPNINLTSNDFSFSTPKSTPILPPLTNSTPLLLTEQNYQLLLTHLLNTDFATQDLAANSTASWISKAAELAGHETSNWGQTVLGRKPVIIPSIVEPTTNGADTKPAVNVLMGVRKKKKRKVDSGGTPIATAAADAAAATTMNKDEKTRLREAEAEAEVEAKTLPTDLMKKKKRKAGSED